MGRVAFRLAAPRRLGEVHAAEEGVEAGVGAEGVDLRASVQERQHPVAFLRGFF